MVHGVHVTMAYERVTRSAGALGADSPQVPDAHLAVITGRSYAVLLLVRKVNVSDGHQVSVWNVCHFLHAANVPHLEHSRHNNNNNIYAFQLM